MCPVRSSPEATPSACFPCSDLCFSGTQQGLRPWIIPRPVFGFIFLPSQQQLISAIALDMGSLHRSLHWGLLVGWCLQHHLLVRPLPEAEHRSRRSSLQLPSQLTTQHGFQTYRLSAPQKRAFRPPLLHHMSRLVSTYKHVSK